MSTTNQPSHTPVNSETSVASTRKPVPLGMQIVVRRDLPVVRLRRCFIFPLFTTAVQQDGWGVGPLMAQVAHATSAVSLNDLVR